MINDGIITLSFKNISPFILFWSQSFFSVWETDGGRRRPTTTLSHNFWPYHAMLSSGFHLELLLLGRGYSTGGPLWAVSPAGRLATHWRSPWLIESLLAACLEWLKINRISIRHLHILFHNAHHLTASTYLHKCILCREISERRLGQRSICNIWEEINYYLINPRKQKWSPQEKKRKQKTGL